HALRNRCDRSLEFQRRSRRTPWRLCATGPEPFSRSFVLASRYIWCRRTRELASSFSIPQFNRSTFTGCYDGGSGEKMLKECKEFVMRGNVLDLAIAVIIGAAFGRIVTSLVNDIIMPPIGIALGKVDFSNLFIDLSGANHPTIAAAKA